MSKNLKQMHQDIDKYYSKGYLDAWCSYVHTVRNRDYYLSSLLCIYSFNRTKAPKMWRYFILNLQEWQEFLDRAFSILIPQVLDQSLDASTNNEGEEGMCLKFWSNLILIYFIFKQHSYNISRTSFAFTYHIFSRR